MTRFDEKVSELTTRLGGLPPDSIAAFSAACAERLSPFYDFFSKSASWGNYPHLRMLLDLLWDFLLDHRDRADELRRGVASIEPFVPHSADFQGISKIGALDFGICLDSAVRWSQRLPPMGPHAPQYSLEILRVAGTLRHAGRTWLADSPERDVVENRLISDPSIAAEIRAQETDLELLEGNSGLSTYTVREIRRAAVAGRYDASRILSVQSK